MSIISNRGLSKWDAVDRTLKEAKGIELMETWQWHLNYFFGFRMLALAFLLCLKALLPLCPPPPTPKGSFLKHYFKVVTQLCCAILLQCYWLGLPKTNHLPTNNYKFFFLTAQLHCTSRVKWGVTSERWFNNQQVN